jgi:glucan phosphoethanolaminetransferase (alkaline phosphatase superfamily)
VLKWWIVAMLVLILPPSFGDIRLIFSTIAERFLVFCKHVILLFGSFYAYVNNYFHAVWLREWIFRISVPYLTIFEYYLRPLAEYIVILLLFAIFDGIIFIALYSVKKLYRYYSKDRKFQLKPTEYMAYLGNEFISSEFDEKPHYMTPNDVAAQQDTNIKQAFLAEMERNL